MATTQQSPIQPQASGAIPQETTLQTHAKYWFVFATFVVLMAVAHGGAQLQGWLYPKTPGLEVHHSVVYYRVIFTIWATLFLVTPALCFHVFSRAGAPNTYWRA